MIVENIEYYTSKQKYYDILKKECDLGLLSLGHSSLLDLESIYDLIFKYPKESIKTYENRVKKLFLCPSYVNSTISQVLMPTILGSTELSRSSTSDVLNEIINDDEYKKFIHKFFSFLVTQPQLAIICDLPRITEENLTLADIKEKKLFPYCYYVDSKTIINYEFRFDGELNFICLEVTYNKVDFGFIMNNNIQDGEKIYFIIDRDEFGYFSQNNELLYLAENPIKKVFASIISLDKKQLPNSNNKLDIGEAFFIDALKKQVDLFNKISSRESEIENHLFNLLTGDINTIAGLKQFQNENNGEIGVKFANTDIIPVETNLSYVNRPSVVFDKLDDYIEDAKKEIFNLMSVRDKSVVRNNTSGAEKSMEYADSEAKLYKGLSSDFQLIEKNIISLIIGWLEFIGFSNLEVTINYPKDFNLLTQDEQLQKIKLLAESKAPIFLIKDAWKKYIEQHYYVFDGRELEKIFSKIDELPINLTIDDISIYKASGLFSDDELRMFAMGSDKGDAEKIVEELKSNSITTQIDRSFENE